MAELKALTTSDIMFWQSEASSCEERQKIELIQRNNYPFLINYYEGVEKVDVQFPHVAAKQRMSIINEFFPNTNALISEIIYQNPDLLIDATKPAAEEGTPIMKAALTYFWEHADGLVENRVALFDMLYAGYCAIEVDIMPSKVEEKADVSVEPERKSVFDQFAKGIKKALSVEDAEDNLARVSPPMETPFATAQGSYIRRYDPLDVPLDWRAERVKDRRYNLKKVWMSKSEFDVSYPKFKDKVTAQELRFEFSKHDSAMHNRKVLLYEFQIRMKDNMYQTIIIAPNVNNEAIDTFMRPYHTNGFNMKIGTLHKYGKLYPRSYAQVNKTMQDEINHYVKHMMEVAERNIPKRLYDKNKVKTDGLEAMRNPNVNENCPVDGNVTGAVTELQPTHVSLENKELLGIFRDQKNKLWGVSEPRISGQSEAKFATELAIQEQNFKAQNVDIQEGLRIIIVSELDTGKDLIATFWDDEVFLNITGSEKMDWYEPIVDPITGNVTNPLSDILTGDYNINIDIASAARKNRDQQLQTMIFYITQLVQLEPINNAQGNTINMDEIRKVAKEFGWNPDKIFKPFKTQEQPSVPTAGGETITPDENAARQAEAEEIASGGV